MDIIMSQLVDEESDLKEVRLVSHLHGQEQEEEGEMGARPSETGYEDLRVRFERRVSDTPSQLATAAATAEKRAESQNSVESSSLKTVLRSTQQCTAADCVVVYW